MEEKEVHAAKGQHDHDDRGHLDREASGGGLNQMVRTFAASLFA